MLTRSRSSEMKITFTICFLRSRDIGVADMAREVALKKLGLFSFNNRDGQAIQTWSVYMRKILNSWSVSSSLYGFKSVKAHGKALKIATEGDTVTSIDRHGSYP